MLAQISDPVSRYAVGLLLFILTLAIAHGVRLRIRGLRRLRRRDPDFASLVANLVALAIVVMGVVGILTALGISRVALFQLVRQLVIVAVLVVLTVLAARFARDRIRKLPYLTTRDRDIAAMFGNLAFIGTLVLGLLTTLTAVGIDLTALVTVLGVTGLAVSLSLQDVLRNFVAGIYLLLEQPFSIGDRIALREVSGEVLGIELRTTQLRSANGAHVTVPNSIVMTEIVTNRSLSGLHSYVVCVSGGRELAEGSLGDFAEILRENQAVCREPEPEVIIESVEAEKAIIRLRFWSERSATAVAEVVAKLERLLPEAVVSGKVEE